MRNENLSRYYISRETLNRTNFKFLNKGDLINMEKSLKYGERISGHFVQGHVDTTSIIKKLDAIGKSWFINFRLFSCWPMERSSRIQFSKN